MSNGHPCGHKFHLYRLSLYPPEAIRGGFSICFTGERRYSAAPRADARDRPARDTLPNQPRKRARRARRDRPARRTQEQAHSARRATTQGRRATLKSFGK